MPQISHADGVAAAHWRQHGRHKVNSLEIPQFLCIEIIPSSVVHPLSQQLDRRLRSKYLLLGHVQVINEDHNLSLASVRPVLTFTPSGADLAVDKSLDLVGVGLSRKGCGQVGIVVVVVVGVELVCHVDGLACTSGADEQGVHVVLDVDMQEVVVTDAVVGGDDEVSVGDLLGDHEGWLGLGPVLPDHLLGIVEHVKHVALLRQLGSVHNGLHFVVRAQLVLGNDLS